VGAYLGLELLKHRSDVVLAVRDEPGWRLANVAESHLVKVDLRDADGMAETLRKLKPQTVFDCTSFGAYSFETDAEKIYATNFEGARNLVQILSETGLKAYIHAGSSSEYGTLSAAPSEDSPCQPQSDYAVSKCAIASYLHFVGKHRSIPQLLLHVAKGQLPPFAHPETSRDFVHVADVAAAFVAAAVRMSDAVRGEDFNIGTGTKTILRELADWATRTYKLSDQPSFDAGRGREWDLADWYANPAKAREILGWSAQVSLAEGLANTMEWIALLDGVDPVRTTKRPL
jgi:dolichol-phosphate mannosyltransferase